jgi:hypothetical protein
MICTGTYFLPVLACHYLDSQGAVDPEDSAPSAADVMSTFQKHPKLNDNCTYGFIRVDLRGSHADGTSRSSLRTSSLTHSLANKPETRLIYSILSR